MQQDQSCSRCFGDGDGCLGGTGGTDCHSQCAHWLRNDGGREFLGNMDRGLRQMPQAPIIGITFVNGDCQRGRFSLTRLYPLDDAAIDPRQTFELPHGDPRRFQGTKRSVSFIPIQ